jgi:hypothetical protein
MVVRRAFASFAVNLSMLVFLAELGLRTSCALGLVSGMALSGGFGIENAPISLLPTDLVFLPIRRMAKRIVWRRKRPGMTIPRGEPR